MVTSGCSQTGLISMIRDYVGLNGKRSQGEEACDDDNDDGDDEDEREGEGREEGDEEERGERLYCVHKRYDDDDEED